MNCTQTCGHLSAGWRRVVELRGDLVPVIAVAYHGQPVKVRQL